MYRVMVVDDDSTSLAICKALLSSVYEVILAKSSLEALGYLKSDQKPDAILLDMIMPGTNGMDMLKILKKDSYSFEIPVIFLTSMEDDEFEVEGYMNGAVDFLKKPVQPDLLKMKLARQIYISNLRKENMFLKRKLAMIQSQVNMICNGTEF